jgi:pyridoxamine 5'-phosphate oxidase
MNTSDLANLRRDYAGKELTKASVESDPYVQFTKWLDEALTSEIIDANAMLLSTVDADCRPSSRVVLLKGVDDRGFVFFTNYESKKAADLAKNPKASLTFFWPQLQRQVHISGTAETIPTSESAAYFKTRPYDSQIGAWASHQSSVIESRAALEAKFETMRERFRAEVPLPPFWGGYRVTPNQIEFWQGRASRLHDRIVYRLLGSHWLTERLSP